MTNKVKIAAKDEKQAIMNASKQLNVDESKLTANLVKEGRKILFGIFKDLPEYEVSYEVNDDITSNDAFSSENKSKFNDFDKINYVSEVKYNKIEDIPDEDMRTSPVESTSPVAK